MSGIWDRIWGEKVIEADTGRGMFSYGNNIYKYKPKNLDDYFKLWEENDLIRSPVDDLVEQTVGTGYYTTVEHMSPVQKKNRAKEYVDEFGKVFNLDMMLPNIVRCTILGGFCPVETHIVKVPKDSLFKCNLKIVHPKTVKDIDSESGVVSKIVQKVNNKENTIRHIGYNHQNPAKATKYDGIAWFVYGQVANDPRGTPLIASMLPIINTLNEATDDVQKILKRYIGPLAIWKTNREVDAIKRAVEERAQGEDIYIGKMTPEEAANPNFPQLVQIDPRVPYWEFIKYLDQRAYKVSRASDMWYFKDATVASARELEDIVQRHVWSIQRSVKRTMEQQWFTPLVEMNALPELPRVEFGLEKTGVEDIEPSDFIVKGLELGYLNDTQYFEILRQLGLDITQLQQAEEEEPEEEEESGEKEPEKEEEKPKTEEESVAEAMTVNRPALQFNAVYDTCMAARFHAQHFEDGSVIDINTLMDTAMRQAWRYGKDKDEVYRRARQILELEGYVIKDLMTNRLKADLSGGTN